MSVQTQIDRLNAIKQRIRTNLVAQGITVPEDTMLEAMAEQILSVAGEDGKDYVLTEADKSEIAALVIDMLGGNPIFGIVDEDNNIIVSGDLPDGTYSVKYEMEDGSKVNIGNLVLDTNVYYSITKNLTNCTINNSATQVVEGEPYSATITANDGYELSSVEVTMGGSPVTVTGGTISITEVTGDIVITAMAEEKQVAQPVTVDITLTNAKRIGSDGTLRDQAGYSVTDDIELTDIPKPCIIHLTGSKWAYANNTDTGYVMYYSKKANGSKLLSGYTDDTDDFDQFTIDTNNGDITDVSVTVKSDEVAFIRFCGNHTYNSGAFANAKATLTYTPES